MFQISPIQLPLLLGFYVGLIAIQFIFAFWILHLYLVGKRETRVAAPYVLVTSLFFFCLAIGRTVFAWFDFILTNFNQSLYTANVGVWKLAAGITTFGLALFAYQLERKPLENKTKGVLTLIVIGFVILMVLYPVTAGDLNAYNIDQTLVIGATAPIIVTPFIYFYLAAKVPGYKLTGIAIGAGMVVYFLGEFAIANTTVTFLQGMGIEVGWIYIVAQLFKIGGMLLMGAAFVKELQRAH